MKKAFLQFLLLTSVFFGTWLLLGRINFVKYLHLENISKKNEQRIGDWLVDNIKKTNEEITSDSAIIILDSIKSAICRPNNIDAQTIHIHLIKSDDINAFALPGRHLVIYTGLIKYCHNPDELCGVIGHEIGHMQHNHIMTRLGREMGFSVLMAAGGGNATIIKQMLKILTSTAFDRQQETEADREAVYYMQRAHIDPGGLANLMDRMDTAATGMPHAMEWISTHPASKERAIYIRSLSGAEGGKPYKRVITSQSWALLKNAVQE